MGSRSIQIWAEIIQWKASELKHLDRKSRKTMTMYGALHPKSNVDRLYVKKRREEEV